jgi:hypothetical protein
MKGWKRLENINPVSGKLREAHRDPYLPVASVRFLAIQLSIHFRMPGLGIHRLDLLRQPHHCLGRIGSEHYMMFPKSMAELSDQ